MNFNDKQVSYSIIGLIMALLLLTGFAKLPDMFYPEHNVSGDEIEAQGGELDEKNPPIQVADEGTAEDHDIMGSEDENYESTVPDIVGKGLDGEVFDEPTTLWVSTFGRLNVRESTTTDSKKIGHFVYHQQVTVEGGSENGFYRVKGTDSRTGEELNGYCHGDYMSIEEPNPSFVYMDIPGYKQTDENWANVRLGSTRRTMAQIGCATTCLAMSESYVDKEKVSPKTMEKRLWYDGRGNLGWPADYTTVSSSNNYLEFIFNKLQEGVPVLVGAETRNGSPHWVLVTGYCGNGEKFYAADFMINDPLPDKRWSLKQFFRDYPRFYKMAYYSG